MDAKLKEDWVKALRSGDFKQGKTYLAHGGEFCCLGVLIEIQGEKVEDLFPNLDDRCTARLPKPYGRGLSREVLTDLANRNDGAAKRARHTFPEIADYIEANL